MKKLLLLMAIFGLSNVALAQDPLPVEGFEDVQFPPANWEVFTTAALPANQWGRIAPSANNANYLVNGTACAGVGYVASPQDEILVTPSFSLVGLNSAYLNFGAVIPYSWFVAPNANGDFIVGVSTDGGLTYTDIWSEEDQGVYGNLDVQFLNLNLSAFLGQSDVRVRFRYLANDADLATLDDVSVTTCPTIGNIDFASITDNSITVTWQSLANNFDFEYGVEGYEVGTGTLINTAEGTATMANLTPGTFYDFYIRRYCDGVPAAWDGPFTINTTNASPAALNYSYDFERPNFSSAGWSRLATSGAAWSLSTVGDDPSLSQDGEQFVFCVGSQSGATNSWLFSRALDLPANVQVTFNYYMRKFDLGSGSSNNNRLIVRIGNATTSAAQTTTLNTHNAITETTYTLRTATFTPTTGGSYFVGFNCATPIQTAVTVGAVLVDAFGAFVPLSVDDAAQQVVSIFPNPTTDVLNINLLDNTKATNAIVTDLTGKIIKTFKLNNDLQQTVDVSDVATGLYLLNVYTEKGTASTKFIKK